MKYKIVEGNPITVAKTYTITTDQVKKLEILEPVVGMKKSEIVRVAIDEFYSQIFELDD